LPGWEVATGSINYFWIDPKKEDQEKCKVSEFLNWLTLPRLASSIVLKSFSVTDQE